MTTGDEVGRGLGAGRSRTLRHVKQTIKLGRITRPLYLGVRRMQIDKWSEIDNVYHCCTQKTASQWFRAVLRDPAVYRNTGWDVVPYRELGLGQAKIEGPTPIHAVAAHLYVDYPTYAAIEKPDNYRTFFILRDPRDCVVSWYFSMRYSHNPEFGIVQELRAELQAIDDKHEGLKHMITRMGEFDFFQTQRTWVDAPTSEFVRVLRYEDFARDNETFLRDLLDFLEVDLTERQFSELATRHSFARRAGGRAAGVADEHHHYRKGVEGDWVNHFDDAVAAHFEAVAGSIVTDLGYG